MDGVAYDIVNQNRLNIGHIVDAEPRKLMDRNVADMLNFFRFSTLP